MKIRSDYIDKKDLYTTLNCIRKLKEINSENVDVMVLEAEYYENRGNIKKALEKISEAIEKDESNALSYYLRGRYKTIMGKLEGAYEDIRKAITLDKDNYEYKSVLAKLYLDLGNYEYARNLYEKIIHVYKTKEVRDCFISANKFIIEDINEIPQDEINIEEKMSLIKSHLLLGQLEEAYEIIKRSVINRYFFIVSFIYSQSLENHIKASEEFVLNNLLSYHPNINRLSNQFYRDQPH